MFVLYTKNDVSLVKNHNTEKPLIKYRTKFFIFVTNKRIRALLKTDECSKLKWNLCYWYLDNNLENTVKEDLYHVSKS